MIAALITLAVMLLIFALLFLVACMKIERLQADARQVETNHGDCIERVMWGVQNEFAAVVLKDAAAKWDSVENRSTLEQMRARWKPGEEGVAAQWMRNLAEQWKNRERPDV